MSTDSNAPEASSKGDPAGRLDAARFEIVREIDKGGMATVFLATDAVHPDKPVALKVIHPHLSGDLQLQDRFKHEVRAHIALNHGSIVKLLGWGEDPRGRLFMAMEYIDGPSLKHLLSRGRFPADIAVFVAARILDALREAHSKGVIHRDIKPANIMLTKEGRPKLADFGIAKAQDMTQLTATGNVIGTPAYLSPEQAHGLPLDGRSDLFALGVLLHEMLVGSNPFHTDNAATTLQRVLNHQVRPLFESRPETPARLESLVERLLQKNAGDRPKDAHEALKELMACREEYELSTSNEVMARFIASPETVAKELSGKAAQRHHERGVTAYKAGGTCGEGALWEFFLATQLDPSHAEAKQWLEQLSSERGYNLKRQVNPRIIELEEKLQEDPNQLPVVLQLAKLHKAQGNFLQVIFYYKRANALRPDDRYTQGQIDGLVSSRSRSIIEGADALETIQMTAPGKSKPEPVADIRHDNVGDFVRAILRTTWAKLLLAGGAVFVVLLALVGGFDKATEGSRVAAGQPEVQAGSGDPEFDKQTIILARAQEWANKDKHEKSVDILQRFVEDHPDSVLAPQAYFLLGDAFERLGRRPEAMSAHEAAAEISNDGWAAKSLGRQAEIHLVDGSQDRARDAYESMAGISSGDDRLTAILGIAQIDVEGGDAEFAMMGFDEVIMDAEDDELRNRARLAKASRLQEQGESFAAVALYEEVRDSSDHRSEAYEEAVAALSELE